MSKSLTILSAIMLLQVALIAVTSFKGQNLDTQAKSQSLLDFSPAEINSLLINSIDEKLELQKLEGKWQLANTVPANESKINALLEKAQGLKFGLPIANSSQALKRFKVDEKTFERKLDLMLDNGGSIELLLGTGAGANQSHIRRADQNAVYTASIGIYDVPISARDWQDKTLLSFSKDKLTHIALDDLAIKKVVKTDEKSNANTDQWKIDSSVIGDQLDNLAIDESISKLSSLSTLHTYLKSEINWPEEGSELKVDLNFGEQQKAYHFIESGNDSNSYYVSVSDQPYIFEIASFSADQILEGFSKAKWIKAESNVGDEAENQTDNEAISTPLDTLTN